MSSSLGQRANRIVNRQDPETRTPRVRPVEARRQPTDPWNVQLLARWKSMAIKLFLVIRVYAVRSMARTLLGPQSYLRIFGAARRAAEAPEAPQVSRVIKGQVVGKPLPPGDNPVTIDPVLCTHPEKSMKPRGNRSEKWWTREPC